MFEKARPVRAYAGHSYRTRPDSTQVNRAAYDFRNRLSLL